MRERQHVTAESDLSIDDKLLEELLRPLYKDDIASLIKKDRCLTLLSKHFSHLCRQSETAMKNARQQLRRMARILIEIRKVNPSMKNFENIILNGNYQSLINAVYSLCEIHPSTASFRKPALAQVLRSTITTMLEVLATFYLENGHTQESEEYKMVQRFLKLHEKKYGAYISKSATRTRKEIKLREEMPLPSPEDLKLLTNYITTKAEEAYNYLTTVGFSYTHWLLLSKCVLLSIIIFNRRRVGEASQMKKEMYLKKNKISEKERSMLTRLERMRADKFSLMRLIAKRGHIVNVLLNPIQVTYIDTLLHFRCEAGVEEANEFLFATPGDNKHVDASQALRQFSDHCGAKNPASLRGTYFRKQVATMAQILSMDDNQIHQLAAAMGHSDAVHRNVYRQNEKLFQVTQLSKLLMVVGEPDFEKYRGKTLDEITSMAEQEAEGATPAVAATTRPQNTPEEATGDIMRLTPKKRTPKKQTIEDIQYQLRRTPKKRVKRPFTKTEIEIMEACFADHLETKTLATMAHCEQILQSNRETFYSSRSARDIYNWVQYQRNKTTRQHK